VCVSFFLVTPAPPPPFFVYYNSQALSRKALVLGELGRTAEALAAVKLALSLEPGNADLVAQERELGIIEAERLQEIRAYQMFAATTGAGAGAGASSSQADLLTSSASVLVSGSSMSPPVPAVPATAAPSNVVDRLRSCITELVTEHGTQSGVSAKTVLALRVTTQLFAQSVEVVGGADKDKDKDASTDADTAVTLRVYARTSGTLAAVLDCTRLLCDAVLALATTDAAGGGGPPSESTSSLVSQALMYCFTWLSVAVDQQRASKLLLVESKLFGNVKAVFKETMGKDKELLEALLKVMLCCCADDVSVKSRTAVVSDKSVLCMVASVLGNVSFEVKSKNRDLGAVEWSILQLCAQISKVAAFTEQGQATLAALDAVGGATLACGIACALYTVNTAVMPLTAGGSKATNSVFPKSTTLSFLVEAALGISQQANLRERFALSVTVAENKLNGSSYSSTLCGSLIATLLANEELVTNGIAALMNACLEPTNAVQQAVLDADGLRLSMSGMLMSEAARASQDLVTLVRKAGLLARLAGTAAAQEALLKIDAYAALCRCVSRLQLDEDVGIDADRAKWLADERSHYIRVLANLTKPTAACLTVGLKESILAGLLAVFPMPRLECGEITARSVTLMPAELSSALLLGNAARCLMAYADDPRGAAALYSDRKLLGVERLICAMASCPDIRVRRNIAILLAKGCRLPGVRERITDLRGMQMMVELQSQL
jgi:hypothetical protein